MRPCLSMLIATGFMNCGSAAHTLALKSLGSLKWAMAFWASSQATGAAGFSAGGGATGGACSAERVVRAQVSASRHSARATRERQIQRQIHERGDGIGEGS